MVDLTVHGGVGEIGGNKVLLGSTHGGILLDFGMSFNAMADYYSEFCQPRGHSYLKDQLELGLLPDLPGLYREDYVRKAGAEPGAPKAADAIFISHAHMDHVGFVPMVRPDIPVYMLPASRAILECLDTFKMASGPPDKFLTFHEKFLMVPAKKGGFKRGKGTDVGSPRDVRVLEPRKEVEVCRDLAVRTMPVDHSLPGASGFIVHIDGQTWVYTGDLRFHGSHRHLSEAFVDAAAGEDVDVLLTEGTRVGEGMGLSEADVRERITQLIMECDHMVLANYPGRDLDRIVSFYEAARAAGRQLVVDCRQALVLETLATVDGDEVPRLGDGVRVLARPQRWGVIGDPGYDQGTQEQDYERWERPFVFSPHSILVRDVRDEPDGYVVFMDFYHLQALADLQPPAGSVFLRSMVEPFNEDMQLDEVRVNNWMERFGLEVAQVHASGHACGEDLERIVRTVEPRVVVPIHTERPDAFATFHGDVRPPELGKRMTL